MEGVNLPVMNGLNVSDVKLCQNGIPVDTSTLRVKPSMQFSTRRLIHFSITRKFI
jgi:hypothetical protein